MNKDMFLMQLEQLLSKIPREEREEAMDYYRSYFEDAGMENYSARHAAIMEQVTTFAADCLVPAPGRQESAARIYQRYLRWWDATRGERLNPHIFGRCLGNIYTKTKSGTVKYVNVRLREEYR